MALTKENLSRWRLPLNIPKFPRSLHQKNVGGKEVSQAYSLPRCARVVPALCEGIPSLMIIDTQNGQGKDAKTRTSFWMFKLYQVAYFLHKDTAGLELSPYPLCLFILVLDCVRPATRGIVPLTKALSNPSDSLFRDI